MTPMVRGADRRDLTAAETAYLQSHRLGRLATVGPDGRPHVVPVAYRYNAELGTIDIGGSGHFAKRKKFRDIQNNPYVAFVVDDVTPSEPRGPRGLEIRGRAEVLMTGGGEIRAGFDPEMFRITPEHIAHWGIEP